MFSKSSGFFYPIRQIGQQIETKQKTNEMKRNEDEEDQEHTSIFVDFIYSTKKRTIDTQNDRCFSSSSIALSSFSFSVVTFWCNDVEF